MKSEGSIFSKKYRDLNAHFNYTVTSTPNNSTLAVAFPHSTPQDEIYV